MQTPRPARRLTYLLPFLLTTGVLPGTPAALAAGTCSTPLVVPAQGGTFTGVTSGTSALAGSCGSSNTSPEQVYEWTPTTSGTSSIRTCGTGTRYDTVLHVHRTTCTGTEVACNDDTAGCAVGDGTANADHHGSRVDVAVTGGQTYWIVVDGYAGKAGAYTLSISPPAPAGRAPDLIPEISSVSVERNATVAAGDVAEGCAEQLSGIDLLRFSVTTRNVGTASLVLGDPQCPLPCIDHPLAVCGNPAFICSPAQGHNHPHYSNYARYELVDGGGQTVVVGHKQGFCLLDEQCTSPVFTCNYQGLTPGCVDVYDKELGCQYIDITGVPSGSYTLRVTLDPFGQISELDESNNVTTVPVTLTGGGATTTTTRTTTTTTRSTTSTTLVGGGSCGTPTIVPAAGGVFTGTTSGSSQLWGSCGSSDISPERVFLWTPASSGLATFDTCGSATSYDSVVYLRAGTCTGTEIGCNDDTAGCGPNSKGSRVIANVIAGSPYTIVVDGFRGASGSFALQVTPPGGTTTTTLPFPGCSSATVIPAAGGTVTGTTSGLSTLAGSCGSSGTSPERIYSWTPTRSGTATIQTCGASTNYDSVLYVRDGCGGPELGCNDDTANCGPSSKGSRLAVSVLANSTYLIIVDGYHGASGNFTLEVTPP